MANTKNPENFLVVRKSPVKLLMRRKEVLRVETPDDKEEMEYARRLAQANKHFFNREYSQALDKYLELEDDIAEESDPDMPTIQRTKEQKKIDRMLRVTFSKLLDAKRIKLSKNDKYKSGVSLIAKVVSGGKLITAKKNVGVLNSIAYEKAIVDDMYKPRITATTLDDLDDDEQETTNFASYIPHLYYFILPVAIADTYVELGQYVQARKTYQKVMDYTFLNEGIENTFLWLRLAKLYIKGGDQLFRNENVPLAKTYYEKIVILDNNGKPAIPILDDKSYLYFHNKMRPMVSKVTEVIKKINGLPHNPVNPKIIEFVIQAYKQLLKIKNGLNFLGLSETYEPIYRFKYLQKVASYMIDQAIQAERTYINFRTSAEKEAFEVIQLQNNLEESKKNQIIELAKQEAAKEEFKRASKGVEYANLRKTNLVSEIAEFQVKGQQIADANIQMNYINEIMAHENLSIDQSQYVQDQMIDRGLLTQNFTAKYDAYNNLGDDYARDIDGNPLAPTYEKAHVTTELVRVKEQNQYELQLHAKQNRLAETDLEIATAQNAKNQALYLQMAQQLSYQLAEIKVQNATEILDFAQDKTFDADLWYQLSNEIRDISQSYLDNAIYAAFIMEKAYNLEFDRNLNVIRFNYYKDANNGLLAGDYLKRDIDSFTMDYLKNSTKKNPIRIVISLSEEFPNDFSNFLKTGTMDFTTELKYFDRKFPGTYKRIIKTVEVYVEGLIPSEGISGTLTHTGFGKEWKKKSDGTWSNKSVRNTTRDHMVISTYQLRRDLAIFQTSEEQLGIFENLYPQGNWILELPPGNNNIDYSAISDVKVVIYFDADYSEELKNHVKTILPNMDKKSLILSSRFHFPDEYFQLDSDRKVTFRITNNFFPSNRKNFLLNYMQLCLVDRVGKPLQGINVGITRSSDQSKIQITTDINGRVTSNLLTMAPFNIWKSQSPINSYTVSFDNTIDTKKIGDVQFGIGYSFEYRTSVQ